jgi:tetratricopeptide (TPR) repeat protein
MQLTLSIGYGRDPIGSNHVWRFRSHSAHNNVLTFLSSPPSWKGPTAPQIFFGRDTELAQIIHMITVNVGSHPARIAILGPGGYGKTTPARAVLTVEQIQEHFRDARYFVPCESVTSSGALLTELGKSLGVLEGGSDALWSRIQAILTSKDSIICFDNFESPWDQDFEIKYTVEELLSRVTELHSVTVLITMRGAERPSQTQWTQPFLGPLQTLDHNSAKEIWQAIAGNYDDFSEKLIDAVDYVPLAIDLLSHLSQVVSPALLWEEWNFKQTKAIQTGQGHRLSNLEYSIQLSINSGRMKANLPAKNLLGVLSMLSDGLHVKQLGKFREMFADLDVASCLQTLLKCSLIKLTKERYQPHPIVHHFCVNEGMVSPGHKKTLEGFYITLASSIFQTASPETYQEMVIEVNNTKATLLRLLESNYEDQSSLITASINFTKFSDSIGDFSERVISQVVEFVQKNSGDIELLILSFETWGQHFHYANNFEKAQEMMQKAEQLCLLSSSYLHGQILQSLGDIYHQQDAFDDAEACYQKALKLHQDRNDILNQGTSYTCLGFLNLRQGKINEAFSFYQSAIQCHEAVNATFELGNDYQGLGQIYMEQNRPIEAEFALQKALQFHKITNSFLAQGNDYLYFGELYISLNKLEDAVAASEKALELYKLVNSTQGQGNVHQQFGDIYLAQGKINEAESSYTKALEAYTRIGTAHGQGRALTQLGYIYMQQGQLHDAKEMFEKATDFHEKAQNAGGAGDNAEYLSAVITQIKEEGSTKGSTK